MCLSLALTVRHQRRPRTSRQSFEPGCYWPPPAALVHEVKAICEKIRKLSIFLSVYVSTLLPFCFFKALAKRRWGIKHITVDWTNLDLWFLITCCKPCNNQVTNQIRQNVGWMLWGPLQKTFKSGCTELCKYFHDSHRFAFQFSDNISLQIVCINICILQDAYTIWISYAFE